LAAIAAREIDPDDAYGYAMDKRPFQRYVTDTNMMPKLDATGVAPTAPTPTSTSAA
jgi:twitching motility protein PilT